MIKGIWVGLVAIAFVAGTIMTGTMAYAAQGGQGDNLIVDALNNIADAINGINPNVNVNPTPVEITNEVVGPSDLTADVTIPDGAVQLTVNAPQGPKGDKGDKGDSCTITGTVVSCEDGTSNDVQGPQGPAGAFPIYVKKGGTLAGTPNGHVFCDSGDEAISGGFNPEFIPGGIRSLILASFPLTERGEISQTGETPTGWGFLFEFPAAGIHDIFVVCLDKTP